MLCSSYIMLTINAMKISENDLEIEITLIIYSFTTVRGASLLVPDVICRIYKKKDSVICEN